MTQESCSHDCGSCQQKCEEAKKPDFSVPANSLSNVQKVIGIVSGKGGVGKSLVTSLLASAMQKRGSQCGILDADITGPSIPKMFGVETLATANESGILPQQSKGGVDMISVNLLVEDKATPVIWRGPAIAGVVKQFWSDVIWSYEDYLFVDMPPGTGDVPLTVFQSLPVDGIVVVTTPQDLVSMIVTKAVKMAEMMHIPVLGLVENYSYFRCPDCGKEHAIFGESHIERVAADLGLKVLARLPIDPAVAAACDAGRIEELEPNYLTAVAELLAE